MKKFLKVLGLVIIVTGVSIYAYVNWDEPDQGVSDVKFTQVDLPFVHRSDLTKSIPFMGGAALDVDNDGRDEIFLGGGKGQPDQIFTYKDGALVDTAYSAGLIKPDDTATFGAASVDTDGDGFVDLFVVRENGLSYYRNTGTGFEGDVLPVTIESDAAPMSVALGDINKDGAVDLYISNYIKLSLVEGETIFNKPYGPHSQLFLNDGNGNFTDISEASGVRHRHNTFTSVFVDLNGDTWQDLVIAHDTGRVAIFKNNGDVTFTEMKNPTVFSYPMGIGVGDYDNDGDMDLYFSNVGNTLPEALVKGDLRPDQPFNTDYMLLRNDGDFNFVDAAKETKTAVYGFGWGTAMSDMDMDGRDEIMIAQNYARFPGVDYLEKLPGRMLKNYPDGIFRPIEEASGGGDPQFGIAPIVADLNGDMWPDLVWSNLVSKARALINEGAGTKRGIKVRLPNGVASLGAVLTLERSDGVTLTKHIYSSEGLSSDQTRTQFFGLGDTATAKSLTVKFLSGRTETYEAPDAGSEVVVQ